LIDTLFKHPELPAIKRIELLELQELLNDKTDKAVLNKLIFPKLTDNLKLEIASGTENKEEELVLKTNVKDSFGLSYIIRKPLSPSEIGSLHKLFILDNYPIKIDNDLKYLIITNQEEEENTIGGICYKLLYLKIAHIEGIEIAKSYRGRGLAGKLINDFSERLFAEGIKTVTTHYYLKSFFEKFNFTSDSRYGGLVKFLKY
jgi:ribosomal protein S18 acetylase RimI-like enzyme